MATKWRNNHKIENILNKLLNKTCKSKNSLFPCLSVLISLCFSCSVTQSITAEGSPPTADICSVHPAVLAVVWLCNNRPVPVNAHNYVICLREVHREVQKTKWYLATHAKDGVCKG